MIDPSEILDQLRPVNSARVMDLVQNAGLDVSDWQNFGGGGRRAASNPKYCYEWAFVQVDKPIILTLWFANLKVHQNRVYQELNFRNSAVTSARRTTTNVWKARASKADQAIQIAFQKGLSIRVIVCDGRMHQSDNPSAKASRVQRRKLDPISWAVKSYNLSNGDCVLERGARPLEPINVPLDIELECFEGQMRQRFVTHREREARMRNEKIFDAMSRNSGRLICEVPNCGFDFSEKYGELGQGYAHVHHKTPISSAPREGRRVRLDDLLIVCANCHAMIHRNGECREIESLIPHSSD